MAERVYIHIGAPKTGTTYLQQVCDLNRKAMKAAGVLYPRLPGIAHHSALWDLRQMWKTRDFNFDVRGDWDKAVRRVVGWEGSAALLSSELFVYAEKDEIAKALSAFGETEVHVVYTARDLVRQVPAVWQERLRNQRTMRYDVFVADVLGKSKSGMARSFWTAQDAPRALERWSKGIPADRVHVVTMPPSGAAPDELWNRFASVVGLDGTAYPTEIPPSNTSMGAVEAEALRRLNQRHGDDMSYAQYRRIVRFGLFDVLDEVVPDKIKITLSPEEHQALVGRSRTLVSDLRRAGYDVVGDLADLLPPDQPQATEGLRRPDDVTDAEVIDTLLDALYAILKRRAKRSFKNKPLVQAGDLDEVSESTPD